ncbi:MAG: YitT family protein [Clostridia bacterium]|nr:YitT family protein [Clostridia bacterium]
MMKWKNKETVQNILYLLFGSILYALGFQLFLAPASVIIGGATGVATVAHILFSLPVGVVAFAVNLPLLIWCVYENGFRSVMHAVPGIILTSLFLDFFSFLPPIEQDPFVCAALGGAVAGWGIGLLLLRGYTTGGSELAATLLHQHFPSVSVGKWVFIIDIAIIAGAAFAMNKIDALFYSLVVSVSFAIVLDLAVGGAERGKIAFIVSKRASEISQAIQINMHRGVTELGGERRVAEQKTEQKILLCAVKRRELYHLKELVREADEEAFVIITAAEEIVGGGFGKPAALPQAYAKKRDKKAK